MSGKFELRTRQQFAGLIEKRDQWARIHTECAARKRFEHLVETSWARENCALDTMADLALWQAEFPDDLRTRQLQRHLAAAQALIRFTEEREFLSCEDLLALHTLMFSGTPGAGSFRQKEILSLGDEHELVGVEMVRPVVENALEWFQTNSFAQMHEVEKSALMLVKLIDIQPFDEGNGPALRLCSNFFLLKAGYPPAVIPTSKASQYAIAIQNSLRFHTQPIIDLIAEAVAQSLARCLGEPLPPPKLNVLPA